MSLLRLLILTGGYRIPPRRELELEVEPTLGTQEQAGRNGVMGLDNHISSQQHFQSIQPWKSDAYDPSTCVF